MNDAICPYPWMHFAVHLSGEMIICCNTYERGTIHDNDTPITINEITDPLEYFNSSELKQIRRDMMNGIKPTKCQSCYDIEKNNGCSIRQKLLPENNIEELIANTDKETGELQTLMLSSAHMMWGNKCNLQCKMCTPSASDQLIPEFYSTGMIESLTEYDSTKTLWQYKNIQNVLKLIAPYLKMLNVTGGEPLINNDFIEYCHFLVENGYAKDIGLSFHTNLTVIPKKASYLWPNFKWIDAKLSIDAIEESYEYIRYPGKWNIIHKNIQKLIEIASEIPQMGISVTSVFSVYNIHNIPNLLTYLSTIQSPQFNNFPTFIWVHEPSYSNPQRLPSHYKVLYAKACREAIDVLVSKFSHENTHSNIQNLHFNIRIMFQQQLPSNVMYKFIDAQDAYRNTNSKDILPWYKYGHAKR